jgi:hypothetical protein
MLAPVVINVRDDTLDAVPAQAPVLMIPRPEADADLDHEVAKSVEPGREARVSESSPAQGNLTDLTVSRPSSERPLGKAIVDARKVAATRSHSGASYHRPRSECGPQPKTACDRSGGERINDRDRPAV